MLRVNIELDLSAFVDMTVDDELRLLDENAERAEQIVRTMLYRHEIHSYDRTGTRVTATISLGSLDQVKTAINDRSHTGRLDMLLVDDAQFGAVELWPHIAQMQSK